MLARKHIYTFPHSNMNGDVCGVHYVCVCASIEWHDQLLLLLLLPFHISITIAPLESIPYALNNTHNYSYIQFLLRPLLLLLLLLISFFFRLFALSTWNDMFASFIYVRCTSCFHVFSFQLEWHRRRVRLFECVDYTYSKYVQYTHTYTHLHCTQCAVQNNSFISVT